jgi:hypothetical protein
MTSAEHDALGSIGVPSVNEITDPKGVGARLDANHAPETNGWMAVCRKCGIRTEGPQGGHTPHPLQLAAAESWLEQDSLGSSIARMKIKRDT